MHVLTHAHIYVYIYIYIVHLYVYLYLYSPVWSYGFIRVAVEILVAILRGMAIYMPIARANAAGMYLPAL